MKNANLLSKVSYSLILLSSLMLMAVDCCKVGDASFRHEADRYKAGDTINFYHISNKMDTYDWEFGDGKKSTEDQPFHIFDTAGTYNVKLKVSSECVSDEESMEITIKED